jgi:hypothetical protein
MIARNLGQEPHDLHHEAIGLNGARNENAQVYVE